MEIDVKAVRGSRADLQTGEVALEVQDDAGAAHVIRIAPQAMDALIRAVLTRPPAQPGQPAPWTPTLPLNGVRRLELASGLLGLEIALGPGQAIVYTFPRTSLGPLQRILNGWGQPQPARN